MSRNDRFRKPTLGDIFGDALSSLFKKPPEPPKVSANQLAAPSLNSAKPPVQRTMFPTNSLAYRNKREQQQTKPVASNRKVLNHKAACSTGTMPRPKKEAEPRPPPVVYPDERRQMAAVRVREVVAAAFPSIDESRPSVVSDATAAAVAAAVARGSQILAERPSPDFDAGFIVGIDFGTSAVKLAIAQPYRAGDPVKALTTPTCLRSLAAPHPHLWPTAIWFNPESESFSLVPKSGGVPLDGFKAGLISGLGHRRANPAFDVTRSEACAAFLALQLAHLFGQYALKRPLGESGGSHFLAVNIGVPVDSMDRRDVVESFKRTVQAAHLLATDAANLTLSRVRKAVAAATPVLPAGFDLVPELAAAIAGYAADPTTPSGPHMLVDVGAATLDIVAFNLLDRGQKVAVMSSGVEMFGAASLDWARLGGVEDAMFKDACDHQFGTVLGYARSPERDPRGYHPSHRGSGTIRLVTTGGGCATALHTKFIGEMVKPGVLGEGQIGRPVPPALISTEDCDRSRLLLAYGLTRDVTQIARCRLPSQIENLPKIAGYEPSSPISKDMM